jgi:flagellar biosynthesis GTPase FlhF
MSWLAGFAKAGFAKAGFAKTGFAGTKLLGLREKLFWFRRLEGESRRLCHLDLLRDDLLLLAIGCWLMRKQSKQKQSKQKQSEQKQSKQKQSKQKQSKQKQSKQKQSEQKQSEQKQSKQKVAGYETASVLEKLKVEVKEFRKSALIARYPKLWESFLLAGMRGCVEFVL